VYGPAEAVHNVEVVRLSSELWVEAPSWIISGNKLNVRGIVTVEMEPLRGCDVVVKGGDLIALVTGREDGSFEVALDLPLIMFTSKYPYAVTASPAEAWIDPCTVHESIFVVNVFTLVGAPVFFGAAIVYTVRRIERRPSRRRDERVEGEDEVVELEPLDEGAPTGDKVDTFPDIYRRAVTLVHGFTGSPLLPNQTIREYLWVVKERLGESVYGVFLSLSMSYERWLYGVPFEIDLSEALKLFEELEELLGFEG
jgi:hypothetical protein